MAVINVWLHCISRYQLVQTANNLMLENLFRDNLLDLLFPIMIFKGNLFVPV